MMTLVAVLHIVVALVLIALVLVQDSKGGGALGMGGGGSNSLLGATGAQTLAARMTRWVGFLFAVTCIALTLMTAHQNQSVVDSLNITPASAPTAAPGENAPPENAGATAAPVQAPAPATPPAENAAPATK